jgi:hypothetical protein
MLHILLEKLPAALLTKEDIENTVFVAEEVIIRENMFDKSDGDGIRVAKRQETEELI